MTETHRGSEDGFVVRCFYKGSHYDIADTLARAFINAGWAIQIPVSPAKDSNHVSNTTT